MAKKKDKTIFRCKTCGTQTPKWMGQCPDCGDWDSLIEETLEREIKPVLKKDGGDIELVDLDGNRILVKLHGRCSTCAASQVTLKDYVQAKIQELVSPELEVEEVQ